MAHLEVLIPDRDPMIVPIVAKALSIGRGDGCDIHIPSKFVSTRHTSIELAAIVTDLGSTNGTWVADEQVKERALRTGESFHFGWRDQVQLRLVLEDEAPSEDGTAELPVENGREEIAEFEVIVQEQKAEIDRLHAKVDQLESARIEPAHDTIGVAGSRIISQPVMEPASSEPAPRDLAASELASTLAAHEAEIAKLQSQLGAMSSDLNDERQRGELLARERDQLVEAVADLERSQRDSSPAHEVSPPSLAAEPARPHPGEAVESNDLVGAFAAHCGLQLDETLLETMRRRTGLADDFGYACGKLLTFSRDVEQLISAMSLEFRGTNRLNEGNVTMLPGGGSRDNLRRSIQALFMQGGADLRSAFDTHIDHLGKWYLACVSAYKAGIEQWYPDFRKRLARSQIERRVKVGGLVRAFGLHYRDYWEAYGEILQDLTDEIIIDEIDQAAAREAVKIAESGNSARSE